MNCGYRVSVNDLQRFIVDIFKLAIGGTHSVKDWS